MKEFWEAACDPGGLAWDDTSNNRAFLGQTIGATLNGASIYFVPRNDEAQYPGLADNINHFLNPEGPTGRYHFVGPRALSIMEYSPNKEAAAEYIRWSSQEDNFSEFMTVNQGYTQGVTPKWETHPVWAVRSGDRDLRHQSALRPHRRLRRPVEPAVGRGAGEVHHRRHVRPRGARRGSRGDRCLGAAGARERLRRVTSR